MEGPCRGPGINLREVEELHQLSGCCIPPWSRQCLPDQGTAGSRKELGRKGLESSLESLLPQVSLVWSLTWSMSCCRNRIPDIR